jgi:N-acetylglutamate synthase-like GNAT family acetyltransferase
MEPAQTEFIVSTDKSLLQIERIHKFLSEKAYWSVGIPKSILEKAMQSSLCFGLYERQSGLQVGFARIVTDKATFAWLCDVYVEEDYRGRGGSKLLMENIVRHSSLQNLRRFCLTTKDAHSLYEQFGFQITKTPSFWMEIKDNEIYEKRAADAVI